MPIPPLLTLVQKASAYQGVSLTGGDLGPGTRGMGQVTATFGSPITAGNLIIIGLMGNVHVPAQNVWLGPIPAFVQATPGGSLPSRTYVVAVTMTDAAGTETMIGPITTITIAANNLLNLTPLNPNNLVTPGFTSWSIYAGVSPGPLTLQISGLGGGSSWTEPTTGLVSGASPPTTPLHDSLGNSYTKAAWMDGGAGGAIVGEQALGIFYTVSSGGGSNAIKFVCGGFNSNPIFTFSLDCAMIAGEFSPSNALSTQATNQIQTGSATAIDITLSVTGTTGASITTDYGIKNNAAMMVADLSPMLGIDYMFASMGANFTSTGNPGLNIGAYTLIDHVTTTSPEAPLDFWFWFQSAVRSGSFLIPEYIKRRNAP